MLVSRTNWFLPCRRGFFPIKSTRFLFEFKSWFLFDFKLSLLAESLLLGDLTTGGLHKKADK